MHILVIKSTLYFHRSIIIFLFQAIIPDKAFDNWSSRGAVAPEIKKSRDVTAPFSKKSSFFVKVREVFPVVFFRWTHFPRPCHQTGPESFERSIFMRFSLKETGDSRFCLPESYGAAY